MLIISHGSIFDSKCDLIILPCNSNGGVSSWVQNEANAYELPIPEKKIPFGKVQYSDVADFYKKSNFVGYAASVNSEDGESNIDAIKDIIISIEKFCRSKRYTIVNLPALGTGFGRLDYSDVLSLYKEIIGKSHIEFHVYIPDLAIADLYATDENDEEIAQLSNPRVFISYCRTDVKISNWAKDLADKLISNGVDAVIDRYHLKQGMDLPQWMTNEILKAQKVLMICDKYYAERADTRNAGVGWETMIMQGDILIQGPNSTKYIAIACEGFDKSIPMYMKTKLGISKADVDNDFNKLLETIFEIDIAPEIGQIPGWIKAKMKRKVPANNALPL